MSTNNRMATGGNGKQRKRKDDKPKGDDETMLATGGNGKQRKRKPKPRPLRVAGAKFE